MLSMYLNHPQTLRKLSCWQTKWANGKQGNYRAKRAMFLKAVTKQDRQAWKELICPCFPVDTDLEPSLTDGQMDKVPSCVWTGFNVHSGERRRVIICPHLSLLGHTSEITMTTFLKIALVWSTLQTQLAEPSPAETWGLKEQVGQSLYTRNG